MCNINKQQPIYNTYAYLTYWLLYAYITVHTFKQSCICIYCTYSRLLYCACKQYTKKKLAHKTEWLYAFWLHKFTHTHTHSHIYTYYLLIRGCARNTTYFHFHLFTVCYCFKPFLFLLFVTACETNTHVWCQYYFLWMTVHNVLLQIENPCFI